MLNNFIYAKKKSLFKTALNNGEVLDEAIVFIEDTKEIWNHGTYFDGSTFDSTNIELSILNISNTIADYATIRSAASTAVLPDVIADMETKTEAAATYLPIGDYITKTEVADSYLVKGDYVEEDVFENGVYIVDLNGALHDPNAFTGTADDVTGIGLITDKGKWIVALDEWYSKSSSTAWNGNTRSAWGGYDKTVTGCWIGTSGHLNDFDGEANTDAIIAQLKDTTDSYSQNYTGAPAAEYCRAYSKGYKDVGSWYLPAAGELNEIVLNKDAINAILTKLGKNNLSKNSYTWSSSQYNSNLAWGYSWSKSYWEANGKYHNDGVRPVCELELKKPLKERIKDLESNKANKADVEIEVEVEAPNGVYAISSTGELIDYNLADATATGVAIVADEQKFMIAKSDATDGTNTTLYWTRNKTDLSLTNYTNADGTNSYGYLPNTDGTFGGSTHLSGDFTSWTAGALSDFNGKDNTEVIAAASSHAKDMCTVLNTFNQTEQTAGRSADWYVPACGQLALMYLNMTEINAALAKIGGTALAADCYWSSSEYSSSYAWRVSFNNGYVNDNGKDSGYRVRFVRDLTTITKPLKEKVSELESQLGDINAALDYIINGPKLITFTIDSVEYQAEEGMTWLDWVNSEYNTIMLSISDTKITNGSKYISLTTAVNNEFVDKNETIESVNYYLTAAIPE